MPAGYRAIWPVLTTASLHELRDEAEPDLAAMLNRARLEQAGRARWSLRFGADVPGSGGAAVVLVVDVPVNQLPRPTDPAEAPAHRPAGRPAVDAERVGLLTREGLPASLIADVMHCSTRTVRRARASQRALA